MKKLNSGFENHHFVSFSARIVTETVWIRCCSTLLMICLVLHFVNSIFFESQVLFYINLLIAVTASILFIKLRFFDGRNLILTSNNNQVEFREMRYEKCIRKEIIKGSRFRWSYTSREINSDYFPYTTYEAHLELLTDNNEHILITQRLKFESSITGWPLYYENETITARVYKVDDYYIASGLLKLKKMVSN